MNYHVVLEAFSSLTVQVTLLLCLAGWAQRRRLVIADSDTCWAAVHIGILLLTVAAFFLPHLRYITWADLDPDDLSLTADSGCAFAGRCCLWIWSFGAGTIVAVCIGGMLHANRLIRRAVVDEHVDRFLHRIVPDLASAPKPIGIRVSPDNVSPFCWQFHSPCIVIPAALRDFPAAEQAAIVRHELAHLRLQHPLHLFLQRMVEAIYWFHPLVWWASREAAAAREFRCDRDTVHSRAEVADYLRSLLRLIESPLRPPERLPAGVGFLGDQSLLSRRAHILAETLGRDTASPAHNRAAIGALAIVGLLCSFLWLPVNPSASRRADWSPWPSWSAEALNATGVVEVRDYEVDGHRLNPREYRPQ